MIKRTMVRSVLAVMTLAGVAQHADAAFIYDLRFSDGTKTKEVAANTSYTLQLWGQISGDTTYGNDSAVGGYVSLDPVKEGAGAFGNSGDSASVGVTSISFTNAPGSGTRVNGAARTGYDDNVRGWGGSSVPAAGQTAPPVAGWAKWDFGANPGYVFGTTVAGKSQSIDANTWEVLLAEFVVDSGSEVNATGTNADKTLFQLRTSDAVRSGIQNLPAINYYNDDETTPPAGTPLNYTTGSVSGRTTSVAFTVIPEPTSMAVVALAGLGLLRRRRQA